MGDPSNALRDMAAINLRFALAEIVIDGGKQAVVRALDHLREAEAFLQIVLIETGDFATEPTIAMAAAIAAANRASEGVHGEDSRA